MTLTIGAVWAIVAPPTRPGSLWAHIAVVNRPGIPIRVDRDFPRNTIMFISNTGERSLLINLDSQ